MFNFINIVKVAPMRKFTTHIQDKIKISFKYSTAQSVILSSAFNETSHWKEYKYMTSLQKSVQMFHLSKDWMNSMAVKTPTQKRIIGKWLSYLDKEIDTFIAFPKTVSTINSSDINLNLVRYEDLKPEKSPMEVVYLLAETLENQNISYAIGGAIALSHYTVSKATSNIDVNIWINNKSELKSMLNVLHSISSVKIENENYVEINLNHYIDKCYSKQNIMRFFWYDVKIKMFLPAYSLLKEQVRNTIQFGLPHPETLKEIPIISKESLAIFKLWWYRDKDIADLKMLLYMNTDIDATIVIRGIKSLTESEEIKSKKIVNLKNWETLCNEYNIDPQLKI